MLANGERDALLEIIFQRYGECCCKYEIGMILVEGAVAEGLSSNLELNGAYRTRPTAP